MPRPILATLPVAAVFAVIACGGGRQPPMTSVAEGWSEEGVASWYGPGFDGKRTASGEVYDMEDLTAAHPRLPFGTRLRVENLDNGRRTEVRVNDRGPFVDDRIIDLSRAAARDIGMLGPGTARVRLFVVQVSALLECSLVQVGAFALESNADALGRRLRDDGQAVIVRRSEDGLNRVYIGPYEDLAQAQEARDRYDGILRPCQG